MSDERSEGNLGFLDSLTRLFRRDEAPLPADSTSEPRSASLEADFEAAIRGLNEKIEQRLAESAAAGAAPTARTDKTEERIAEKVRRMAAAHRAIREDIEGMHARLGTGLDGAALTGLASFLEELDTVVREGKDSHSMLPRARYAIALRLQTEAGELAVTRLVALLQRENMPWPDPIQAGPLVTPEQAENARSRRLAEIRESFLASGFKRTATRLLGVVSAWGSDYPERGSPLWQESVLEGVAAGIRADLVREFADLLRRDSALLLDRTQGAVGKELGTLQQVLRGGITSIEQANEAVASALRVLDEVFPEVAWQHVQSQLPRARGEWPA